MICRCRWANAHARCAYQLYGLIAKCIGKMNDTIYLLFLFCCCLLVCKKAESSRNEFGHCRFVLFVLQARRACTRAGCPTAHAHWLHASSTCMRAGQIALYSAKLGFGLVVALFLLLFSSLLLFLLLFLSFAARPAFCGLSSRAERRIEPLAQARARRHRERFKATTRQLVYACTARCHGLACVIAGLRAKARIRGAMQNLCVFVCRGMQC